MYKGSMVGAVGQLSPINWGNITSNVFLGYSKHHGDFDNGEFLGGGMYVIPAATYSLIMFATSLIFVYLVRKTA